MPVQANRPVDAGQQYDLLRLQTQAFEAINEMVRSASSDTVPLVGHLIPVVLQKMATTLQGSAASPAHNASGDLEVRCLPGLGGSCSKWACIKRTNVQFRFALPFELSFGEGGERGQIAVHILGPQV